MRTLSAPLILSSMMLLAGGWSEAAAQSTGDGLTGAPGAAPEASPGADETLPPGVIAQPDTTSPGLVVGIRLGELYTDNLMLADRGQPKRSAWVTTVQPFVKWAHAGPRFSGVLDYSLAGYLYNDRVGDSQLAHHLDARGTLAVVPGHLFLDGAATYAQEVVDNKQPAGSGTYFLSNNRANVATATLSPYWLQDLGRVGTMTLRYTHGRVVYNRHGLRGGDEHMLDGRPNVSSDGVQFDIESPDHATWGWNLAYDGQRLKPDSGSDLKFATARLGVSRQVGIHARILADVGKENRYLDDGTVDQLGAGFWDVGLEWSNVRNHVRVLAGHRFYGHSTRFTWTHAGSRLQTELDYEERPTDLNRQFLRRGAAVGMPSGTALAGVPSLSERRVYLMKRASASATYEMARSRLRVAAYDESRDFFISDGGRERVADAHVSWAFDLGPDTTLTPGYGWQRYRFRDGQVNYTRYVQLTAVHRFDPNNFASLKLRHGARNAYRVAPGAHGYRVNVVYLEWTHLF